MSKYEIWIDHILWRKENSKDDVIQALLTYINGDGVIPIKMVYPDGSYWEYVGEVE